MKLKLEQSSLWLEIIFMRLIIISNRLSFTESLDKGLPPAFFLRVGLSNTAARYYLGNHAAVRPMLREMALQNRLRHA
ncbi:MAG TPA: hypothetical protein VH619_14960 [Verrucomicrobiae bacterium]|nr:hypothetical protein [Verrucomicrobiae bacterium]